MQGTIDNQSKFNSQFGIESSLAMKHSLQQNSMSNTPLINDRANFKLVPGDALQFKGHHHQDGIFSSSRNPMVESLNNQIY